MPTVLGLKGSVGKVHVPSEPALGIFAQGANLAPNMPAQAVSLITVGHPQFTTTTTPGFNKPVTGNATSPVVWTYDEDQGLEDDLKPLYDFVAAQLSLAVNEVVPTQEEKTLEQIVYPFTAETPHEGFIAYQNDRLLSIRCDSFWHAQVLSRIQFELQTKGGTLFRRNLTPHIVGLGTIGRAGGGKDFKLRRRPTTYVKWMNDQWTMQFGLKVVNQPSAAVRGEAIYNYLAAYALREFVRIEGLTIHDYVAITDMLHLMYHGPGNAQFERRYSASDIYSMVTRWIGIGFNKANAANWLDIRNGADIKAWIVWNHLFAMKAERTKPHIEEIEFMRTQNSFMNAVSEMADIASRGPHRDIGSVNWWLPMARNNPKNPESKNEKDKYDEYIFCIVSDMPVEFKKVVEVANKYDRIPQRGSYNWGKMNIVNGEIPANAIDTNMKQEANLLFIPSEDARMIEITLEQTTVYEWQISLEMQSRRILSESDIDEMFVRKYLYLRGLFTNAKTLLKDGYELKSTFGGIFEPVYVQYTRHEFTGGLNVSVGDGPRPASPASGLGGPSEGAHTTEPADSRNINLPTVTPEGKTSEPSVSNPTGGVKATVKDTVKEGSA